MKNFYTPLEIERIKKEIQDQLLNQQETVLLPDDVAKMFHWDVKTVYNMIGKRKIPAFRVSGKTTVFLKSVLIEWIKENRLQ